MSTKTTIKKFKVVALSDNTNSFGLRGIIMLAEDGETWQAAANSINTPELNSTVSFVMRVNDSGVEKVAQFPLGFEIPQRMEDLPQGFLEKEFS